RVERRRPSSKLRRWRSIQLPPGPGHEQRLEAWLGETDVGDVKALVLDELNDRRDHASAPIAVHAQHRPGGFGTEHARLGAYRVELHGVAAQCDLDHRASRRALFESRGRVQLE